MVLVGVLGLIAYVDAAERASADPAEHDHDHCDAPAQPSPAPAEPSPAPAEPTPAEPGPPAVHEIAIVEVAGCTSFDVVITTPFPEAPTILKPNQVVKLAPRAPHDITAGDPGAATGTFHAGSDEVRCYKFTDPGRFPYHCSVHPSMRGVIEVR